MDCQINFNSEPSTIMHLDLNSCFATIEQQANPQLRGKPVAVAAYTMPSGCIIAPSVEAKRYGIKTGMRVRAGKLLCPSLIVLPPDPAKYRNVHLALRKIVRNYTNDFHPKSIDEFVLNLKGYITLEDSPLKLVAQEIKERIRNEIGEWIMVSIGISTNRYLAKIASSLHKPDGLDEINRSNYQEVYSRLELTDLTGIKVRNAARLFSMGITSVLDFYNSPIWKLKAAFHSISGYYWYSRLHGYEIDDVVFARRSYGNSFALPARIATQSVAGGPKSLAPILSKLVEKMGARLRQAGYTAGGVHLAISFRNGTFWHKGVRTEKILFDSRDIYKKMFRLLLACPVRKPVRDLAVSAFNLMKHKSTQLDFFVDVEKKKSLVDSIDRINKRWGSFIISPARMLDTEDVVMDRIAFGGVKELEEFTTA